EGLFESLRVEHAEDAAERVVARHPMGQNQHRSQQLLLGLGKQGYVAAALCSAQRRQQGDKQNLRQIVRRIVGPRVGQCGKALRKSFHGHLLPNQETPSESTSLLIAIPYPTSHAIPLPQGGRELINW